MVFAQSSSFFQCRLVVECARFLALIFVKLLAHGVCTILLLLPMSLGGRMCSLLGLPCNNWQKNGTHQHKKAKSRSKRCSLGDHGGCCPYWADIYFFTYV